MEWHEIHATAIRNIRGVLDNAPVEEVEEEEDDDEDPVVVPMFAMVCVLLAIFGLAIKQFHKERSSNFLTNFSVGFSSIGFPSGSEAVFVVYNFILTKNSLKWKWRVICSQF
ncbi:hypothetical protein GCK72_017385 [Caenorhabditis remanei]|uniref:Uncharacterized protein n=1 Tax=Caenorhabditis remanei TaxID=31234 RepID=A0A6A5G8D0_CAERE|nr:hypothetical protein GCK72_017385 [Caenorhabditis remanei]KAF1750834.1 hypothetical protein GCK72_017385 [Caenorhabditis remanei]